MYQELKEDLSVYYWLVDKFSAYPFVKIVDAYPSEDLTLPTISVEASDVSSRPGELGNRNEIKSRLYVIDIFAKTKTQKDEFAYKIFNELVDGIPVYDYDEGFPPSVSPTRLGCLVVVEKNIRNIRVYPELEDELYFRAMLQFVAEYNQF